LALRNEDVELDALLDREAVESDVRRIVEDFNRRIIEARRQLLGGPPVVTQTRDVDEAVQAWRRRREDRRARQREARPATGQERGQADPAAGRAARRARWLRRRLRRTTRRTGP